MNVKSLCYSFHSFYPINHYSRFLLLFRPFNFLLFGCPLPLPVTVRRNTDVRSTPPLPGVPLPWQPVFPVRRPWPPRTAHGPAQVPLSLKIRLLTDRPPRVLFSVRSLTVVPSLGPPRCPLRSRATRRSSPRLSSLPEEPESFTKTPCHPGTLTTLVFGTEDDTETDGTTFVLRRSLGGPSESSLRLISHHRRSHHSSLFRLTGVPRTDLGTFLSPPRTFLPPPFLVVTSQEVRVEKLSYVVNTLIRK